MNDKLEISYILWGLIWWLIGLYDVLFRDFSKLLNTNFHEQHVTIAAFTIGILALARCYYLSKIKFKDAKSAALYFLMYLVVIDLWNFSYLVYKHIIDGWLPKVPQGIAPHIYISVPVWWIMTLSGTIAWILFPILVHLKIIKIEVEEY